jgi:hypothetical protein
MTQVSMGGAGHTPEAAFFAPGAEPPARPDARMRVQPAGGDGIGLGPGTAPAPVDVPAGRPG